MTNRLREFLSGRQFDGSLRVSPNELSFADQAVTRAGLSRKGGRNSAILSQLGGGGAVLHIGCVDHPPLIDSKIAAGTYLHKLLIDFLGEHRVFGFDVNESGLATMRKRGFINLSSSLAEVSSERFDAVLIPDTVEHLQDIGQFLESLGQLDFQRLIITVPNAYSLENRFFTLSESINSDHRTLHSPYSLSKLLFEVGFEVQKITMADYWGPRRPFRALIKFCFPLTREHLIVEARPAASDRR